MYVNGFLSESLVFAKKLANERFAQKKRFAHSLIFGEQPERFAHSRSFLVSDLSDLLTSLILYLVSDLSDLLTSLIKKE